MLLKNNFLIKRKKIKIKRKKKIKLIYPLIVIFFILCLIFIGAYLFFLNKNQMLISPLAKMKYQQSIKLEEALKKANIKFLKTQVQSDLSLLVELFDKEEVIFSSKKDLQSQIASLQLITKRLTIEGKRFKSLDFRYDKPIIKF